MKIVNDRYVLTREVNGETQYLTPDYGFFNDIRDALVIPHIIQAQTIRTYLTERYQMDLTIVRLRITYEWGTPEILKV